MVLNKLLKNPQESFDGALRTNGVGVDIVDVFPFMLRHSKHSGPFFSSLLRTELDANHNKND